MCAAGNGHLNVVKYFVAEKKIDPNRADNNGNTALMYAAAKGHLNVVEYLMGREAGSDKLIENSLQALKRATISFFKNLIARETDSDKLIENSQQALMCAAGNGHLNVVKYFVAEKKIDPNRADNNGNTALMYAAAKGHLNVVKYFVAEKNVDLNQAVLDFAKNVSVKSFLQQALKAKTIAELHPEPPKSNITGALARKCQR